MSLSIREIYNEKGVEHFYKEQPDEYKNPHSNFIKNIIKDIDFSDYKSVLDFSCGNGLITSLLPTEINIEGCDPFLFEQYKQNTKRKCYNYSFKDIALNPMLINKKYDLIICSYAIDLVPKELINLLLFSFSQISENLILIRPNKHVLKHSCWNLTFLKKEIKSVVTYYKNNI